MAHQAWLCRAMSKVSRDVSCFLKNCVEWDWIVNKYHPEILEEEMHMIHQALLIATSELDMNKFGKNKNTQKNKYFPQEAPFFLRE